MCFSAEASFISAVGVGLIGYFTLKEVSDKRQLPLAILPLLFALQQACEGVIWVFLKNDIQPNWLFALSKYAYVLFGYISWPVLFSFSALVLEEVPWRRTFLSISLAIGCVVSLLFVWHFFVDGVQPAMFDHSIRYDVTDRPMGLSYLAILTIPYVFSSVRYLWVLGIAAPISFAISAYFYWENFASVWCFFAAWICCWIYFVIRKLRSV